MCMLGYVHVHVLYFNIHWLWVIEAVPVSNKDQILAHKKEPEKYTLITDVSMVNKIISTESPPPNIAELIL